MSYPSAVSILRYFSNKKIVLLRQTWTKLAHLFLGRCSSWQLLWFDCDTLCSTIPIDEADTRELISTVLAECGAEVTAVGSVDEAIDAIMQSARSTSAAGEAKEPTYLKPDVLVSDIGMPVKDGYVLIRKVKEIEAELGVRIPAIALTAYARLENCQETLLAGFQVHITKPVKSDELIAAVARFAK